MRAQSLYSRCSRFFLKGPRQFKPTRIDVFSDADSESPPRHRVKMLPWPDIGEKLSRSRDMTDDRIRKLV